MVVLCINAENNFQVLLYIQIDSLKREQINILKREYGMFLLNWFSVSTEIRETILDEQEEDRLFLQWSYCKSAIN